MTSTLMSFVSSKRFLPSTPYTFIDLSTPTEGAANGIKEIISILFTAMTENEKDIGKES